MARIHWTGGTFFARIKTKIVDEWFMAKLTYWSLFYNSLTSWSTIMDSAMEPVFWIVDHFVRYLGPAFVVIVVCLTTTVVVIFYTCLLPTKIEQSYFWTVYHLIVGHWVLCNIAFHYFKAAFTDPGHPPQKIPKTASICKKCISPKPPRAHHCSVCSNCILKMDHHCPWLNNCVGHYNHRYFFLFCFYMWLGTMYVSTCAYPLFKEHFYGEEEVGWFGVFYPLYLVKRGIESSNFKGLHKFEMERRAIIEENANNSDKDSSFSLPSRNTLGMYYHHFIIYEFMLCSAVSIALGLLLAWHARLVHRGETSIEVHTNRAEAERSARRGVRFRNPHDFGAKQNWKIFLGLTHGRTFWRHVLFPSSHKPEGDGLSWKQSPLVDNPDGILLL